MSITISDPDVAHIIQELRAQTEIALSCFQSYLRSNDGDAVHLAEAMSSIRHIKTLLNTLELPSDQVPDIAQLRLSMSNIAWDIGQFE